MPLQQGLISCTSRSVCFIYYRERGHEGQHLVVKVCCMLVATLCPLLYKGRIKQQSNKSKTDSETETPKIEKKLGNDYKNGLKKKAEAIYK